MRQCPDWFQDELTRAGGLNPYGEPVFKLVWDQGQTMTVGGYFAKDGFVGYRDMPAYGNDGAWCIVMWEPAELMGEQWRWEYEYRDEVTGLLDLGEYPHEGRYRLIQKLIHREMVGGELVVERLEPTYFILEWMLPMIISWQRLSDAEKLYTIRLEMDEEEKEYKKLLKDSYTSHRVRPGGRRYLSEPVLPGRSVQL